MSEQYKPKTLGNELEYRPRSHAQELLDTPSQEYFYIKGYRNKHPEKNHLDQNKISYHPERFLRYISLESDSFT